MTRLRSWRIKGYRSVIRDNDEADVNLIACLARLHPGSRLPISGHRSDQAGDRSAS